ncbi:MAG: TonB C-terminal domain-containing protein [Verrucomicrobiota bacterium]
MVELKPQDKQPPKPQEAKTDKAPAAPGPKAAGPASDNGIGGGGGDGGDGIGGGGSGTVFGYYAGQVSEQIKAALERNDKTRTASFRIKVRVWSDSSGRIIRATLSGSTGDAAIDSIIRDQVLTGLQLQDPPPQGMPMPIVMVLHEVRPS